MVQGSERVNVVRICLLILLIIIQDLAYKPDGFQYITNCKLSGYPVYVHVHMNLINKVRMWSTNDVGPWI